jgi:hypothetical protein
MISPAQNPTVMTPDYVLCHYLHKLLLWAEECPVGYVYYTTNDPTTAEKMFFLAFSSGDLPA